MVPTIIVICLVGWYCIWTCCRKRRQISKVRIKDYLILSLVLMLFLCYPMLVKLCLSALQCPYVNGRSYLMADLEEPCFEGRHVTYIVALTIPQLILYVFGLPATAAFIVLREPKRRLWSSYSFRMRYGLLFMGYRRERYWWELVIVLRKVTIVMIGTFGTFMGRVDLQAFVALLVVFFSIVVHLIGKPFDTEKKDTYLLYMLEFAGLSVCWLTFWGGLIFYLGPDVIPEYVIVGMTCVIWITNFGYIVYAVKCYVHEYYRDEVKKRKVKKNTLTKEKWKEAFHTTNNLKKWKVHPVEMKTKSDGEEDYTYAIREDDEKAIDSKKEKEIDGGTSRGVELRTWTEEEKQLKSREEEKKE